MNASARAALTRIASGQLPLLGSAAPARMGRPVVTHRTAHEKARRWGLEPARRAFRQRDKSVMVCQGPHRKAVCFRLRWKARDCLHSMAGRMPIRCIGYSRRVPANRRPDHPGNTTVGPNPPLGQAQISMPEQGRIGGVNDRAQAACRRNGLLRTAEQQRFASDSYIKIRIKTQKNRVDPIFECLLESPVPTKTVGKP